MTRPVRFPVTEKESAHGAALSSYLFVGEARDLTEVDWYVARGIDCPAMLCKTNAALQFMVKRWSLSRAAETGKLLERYIDAGLIQTGMRMVISKESAEAEYHDQPLIEVALRRGNLDALLVLVRKGGIENTDFARIDRRYSTAPFAGNPMSAFDDLLHKHWRDRPCSVAQVTESLMRRHISANEPALQPSPAASRRRAQV